MVCKKCGSKLETGDKFCLNCGTKVESDVQQNEETVSKESISINLEGITSFAESAINSAKAKYDERNIGFINREVRKYFFGSTSVLKCGLILWAVSLCVSIIPILGLLAALFMPFALFITFLGFIIYFFSRFNQGGAEKVDNAVSESIEIIKATAFEKFNVDSSQILEVEPITLVGPGIAPFNEGITEYSYTIFGTISLLFNKIGKLMKASSKEPVEIYKTDMNNVTRYLLLSTTVLAFTETQLLVYRGNIDISTGKIYDESFLEIFYEDVNCVVTREYLMKTKIGLFKKPLYYKGNALQLDVCGLANRFSYDTRFNSDVNISLNGMRNYIRDKKN